MSLRVIHFQNVKNPARPLCQRAGVVCCWGNSSPVRHKVTCKLCLMRIAATAKWAAEAKNIRSDVEREMA